MLESVSSLLDDAQSPLQPQPRPRGELPVALLRRTHRHRELPERPLVKLLVEHDVLAVFHLILVHRHEAQVLGLAAAPLRPLGGDRGTRPHGERGHVGARERPPQLRGREQEVYLSRPEELVGGQRRWGLVEVERVGVAHEEGGGLAGENVGDGDSGAGRELLQRAVGGDDPDRPRMVWLLREGASVGGKAGNLGAHGIFAGVLCVESVRLRFFCRVRWSFGCWMWRWKGGECIYRGGW
uniref:Uncharacterized protein n=1 Tax=Triticum urartu TaxID=4572 RepID=A0A8R7UUB8_TRIUA